MVSAASGPPAAPVRARSRATAARLAAAQAGDRAALRELVRTHQRPVGALLRRMLAPAGLDALVEDLAQETFLRAFRALGRFELDGPAKFSTWLLRIASRLAINELQRKRPRLVSADALGSETSPERDTQRQRIGRAIEAAVQALPPAYRAAFLLREYHGLEYAEIATALELEVGTVRSRLSRARGLLRETLRDIREAEGEA